MPKPTGPERRRGERRQRERRGVPDHRAWVERRTNRRPDGKDRRSFEPRRHGFDRRSGEDRRGG